MEVEKADIVKISARRSEKLTYICNENNIQVLNISEWRHGFSIFLMIIHLAI